jgi:hypothetical protein
VPAPSLATRGSPHCIFPSAFGATAFGRGGACSHSCPCLNSPVVQMFEVEIGRGGFGVVYRAQHLLTKELVAIKRFSLRHVEDNLASIQVP